MPLLHAAAQHGDIGEARAQRCRSLGGAPVGAADEDDRASLETADLGEALFDCVHGEIASITDVAKRSRELVGAAHVDQGDRLAGIESSLEVRDLDPGGRTAKAAQQPRQERDHGEQSEAEQPVSYGRGIPGQRFPPRVAEPGVSDGARRHAHERGENVVAERDAREPA